MRTSKQQRGITLLGFACVLAIAGFFALIAMRLIPVYIEYYGVVKSMEQVKSEPNSANKSLDDIRRSLSLKFNLQYVDDDTILPQNIHITRQGAVTTLRISWEKRVPFVYNVDFVASFDHSVILNANVGNG